jgi:2-hydroxycyclohexanecarboxyl-CoA dehydrogenase
VDLGLAGKVALVTGAGRGIGRAIALTLANEGARVVVNDYYEERATRVAEEIAAGSGEALAIQGDVTDGAVVTSMVEAAVERFAGLDILVNNAGIPVSGLSGDGDSGGSGFGPLFVRTTETEWQRTMGVITLGVLHCTHAALPYLVARGGGAIVNIVSDAGRVGEPRLVAYSMAKAGVIGFTRALAREEGRNGVRVNCVSPATTETEAIAGLLNDTSPEGQARLQGMLRQYPLGRTRGGLGRPQDIADAVAFLASERASWVTGQVLSVNGGYSMV